MRRSISATAFQRVRKLSDAVRDAFVHTTTNEPRRTRDDSAFDDHRRGRPRKGEPGLRRALSHRNISKDDIRPYTRVNPSSSTLDLWVGGGKVKDDVGRPRPGAETPLGSRFSADSDVLVMQTRRGRNTEKKVLFGGRTKKEEKPKPVRPPRPAEDLFADMYGEANAEGLAPPPACAVREHEREGQRRQKELQMQMAAGTARAGEDVRHRGSNTQPGQTMFRRGGKAQAGNEVGPPVPPKDCVQVKMSSPFARIPRSVVPPTSQYMSRRGPRDGVGADLTRGSSTKSAPEGTVGVSRMMVPRPRRPFTFDERRYELDMLYATTGHAEAPRTTETVRRTPSPGDRNVQTPTRSPQHTRSRPPDVRHHFPTRSDENEPRGGHAEYRPYKPSPLKSRQPSVAPKGPLTPQSDAYLPEAHHKRRPSEMDIPVDVFPDDGERLPGPGRPSVQPYATVRPSGGERSKPLPPSPFAPTLTMAKVQGTVHVKDASVLHPAKMSMTVATLPAMGRPDSYGSDTVVIAPFSPTISLVSTEERLIESLMDHTADPGSDKRDTYTRGQLQYALAEPELVRPLSIRKKDSLKYRLGR